MQLEHILRVAVRGGASDIILKAGSIPKFRFHGRLVPLQEGQVLSQEQIAGWVREILPPHLQERLESGNELDFSLQISSGQRFRVHLFRQKNSWALALRVVINHVLTLEELQLPKVVGELAREKRGLILVTGATGSGKSTTLAALVQRINSERHAHIVTIEDPIEFLFQEEYATICQRELGIDTHSFSEALRAALRQNPDVILVGELRDKETIETALKAAETGHLVLSTMHTQDAVESLSRILSYFPASQHEHVRCMLAQVLRAVVSQRLIPRQGGRGMVVASEVLLVSSAIRESILSGSALENIRTSIRQGGDHYGMQSFDQAILHLFAEGAISREEALRQASSPMDLELKLKGVG